MKPAMVTKAGKPTPVQNAAMRRAGKQELKKQIKKTKKA